MKYLYCILPKHTYSSDKWSIQCVSLCLSCLCLCDWSLVLHTIRPSVLLFIFVLVHNFISSHDDSCICWWRRKTERKSLFDQLCWAFSLTPRIDASLYDFKCVFTAEEGGDNLSGALKGRPTRIESTWPWQRERELTTAVCPTEKQLSAFFMPQWLQINGFNARDRNHK